MILCRVNDKFTELSKNKLTLKKVPLKRPPSSSLGNLILNFLNLCTWSISTSDES